MKVILCEDVGDLGDMGQTVNVAPGYARNYLLPRRLAVQADSASAKQIEHEMRIIGKREEKRREELVQVAGTLEGVKLEFTAKAGAEGKLFGSITSLHISRELEALGHPVNRRKIQLAEPIKSLGEHDIAIELTSGVGATIKLLVIAEESEVGKEIPEPEEKAAPAEAESEGEAPEEAPAEPTDTEAMPEVVIKTDDSAAE